MWLTPFVAECSPHTQYSRFAWCCAAHKKDTQDMFYCVCRTSLHRALYWGHLQAAALLLEAGAQLSLQDDKVPFASRSCLLTSCSTTQISAVHIKAQAKGPHPSRQTAECSTGQGWIVMYHHTYHLLYCSPSSSSYWICCPVRLCRGLARQFEPPISELRVSTGAHPAGSAV